MDEDAGITIHVTRPGWLDVYYRHRQGARTAVEATTTGVLHFKADVERVEPSAYDAPAAEIAVEIGEARDAGA